MKVVYPPEPKTDEEILAIIERTFGEVTIKWSHCRGGFYHGSPEKFVEIAYGGMLQSVHGSGRTPDAAVSDLVRVMTETRPWLVVDAYKPSRKEYSWDGEKFFEHGKDRK